MPVLSFTIPGPAKGWQRPGARVVGKRVRFYTQKGTRQYEARVADAALSAMLANGVAQAPRDALVSVFIEVYRAGKVRPVRPDLDNIAKGVLDGMTQGGVWGDDDQVYSLCVQRKLGAARVEVTALWSNGGENGIQ